MSKIKTAFLLALVCTIFYASAAYSQEMIEIEPLQIVPVNKVTSEVTKESMQEDGWSLQYKVKEANIYVECILPDFSLSMNEQKGDGYLLLKLDGSEIGRMDQAAFVIKGLPAGDHEITIQPVDHEGKAHAKEMSFEITIA
ncbi:hypothetical protein ACFPU1_05780 [Thalassorhabdus alkalitolerans]|uniref:Uncharacterized protein n=1 Tax=Thalassorhabdus alkalitolerans TaxID=2282697 RepID=A0ABW0YIY3_9BACI